VCAALD
jgi:hypothetical protein